MLMEYICVIDRIWNGLAVANAAAAAAVAAQAAAVQQQMGWGFGTWFKQHENNSRMRPALFWQGSPPSTRKAIPQT